MRRLDTLIILLGAGLLTGCWSNQLRPPLAKDAGPSPLPADVARQEVAQVGLGPTSPYQPRPMPPPAEPRHEPEPPTPPPAPIDPPIRPASHVPPVRELPRSPEPIAIPSLPKDPPVVEALRCLLNRRPADAVPPLEKFDKPTQDLLLRFLPVIARLSENGLNDGDPEELALLTGQLEEVIRSLRPRALLVVDKMCFCRRIDRFGQYDPLPPDYRFRPGEMVQVYVELQNFASRQVNGLYETRLASSVEIQDAQQQTVWRQDFNDRDRPDQSRSLRSDYFNSYRFCIPENIPPGTYRLVMRVQDMLLPERRPAERALTLRVTTRPAGTRPLADSSENR